MYLLAKDVAAQKEREKLISCVACRVGNQDPHRGWPGRGVALSVKKTLVDGI